MRIRKLQAGPGVKNMFDKNEMKKKHLLSDFNVSIVRAGFRPAAE